MQLFDVYPLMNVTPEKASGVHLWDNTGQKYLDLYGGHAVISIGHSHPHYVKRISDQLNKIGFYSNSVQIPLQREMASKLGELSGYDAYKLFLCNSGAEANENALKLASFETGKAGVIAFHGAFHGRTSGAVAITDNQKIVAPFNSGHKVFFEALGDLDAVEQRLKDGEIAAVIIEGIQGVNGIQVAEPGFLSGLSTLTKKYGAKLILDEVQSGYGRTGKFFAHQWTAELAPDLITIAKGMGNGFPIGGVLIHPDIEAKFGLLGTTFGGNHLACAAGLAVLEILEEENLMANAEQLGDFLIQELNEGFPEILAVRGKGLMIGLDLKNEAAPYRSELIKSHHIFTGSAASKNTIRILPPLCVKKEELQLFLKSLREVINRMNP
ncbi:MAG: aspartate aminotransferase family protein [Cytophagales bacterium]|uniref:aspartate aminotransferase family protein n=1 Tax=Cyclobacterium marinum TaxID=104 RepID=UPI0011ECC3F1|nr:aminotransferase class III-fold pyridoxal phosphate-dependent enzyme [Cyclobacterium marinum]MBI0398341.1 aspartate aminotransferase family protein [Cyclobacterium marinum]MBR9776995.1 aspartate aminotransferase family protein [Cytophagales bacterium]|tara:strand:+ start:771 stop:1916 length:1146 start_codon:yes stop_codon:yes gene_type:complete